jgi:hypothetical protein
MSVRKRTWKTPADQNIEAARGEAALTDRPLGIVCARARLPRGGP